MTDLSHVRTWVFDLDNTLYPSEINFFAQIDVRMTDFLSDYLGLDKVEARKIQKHYYATYGTTLSGMMAEHDMTPDAYLEYVHDIDYSALTPAPDLNAALHALPGRRIIFTNGSDGHARAVMDQLGIFDAFHDIVAIEHTGYVPKPHADAFAAFASRHDFEPRQTIMFEDLARNLKAAKAVGMDTALVHSDHDWSHEPDGARPAGPNCRHDFVDHYVSDLTAFLTRIKTAD